MSKRKLWRILALILVLLTLLGSIPLGLAEEEEEDGGEGTVLVMEHPAELLSAESAASEAEPFIPDDVEKTIFGADDRIKVKNTGKYPYSAIARMYVVGECGCKWECTGFMVSENRMLTAAHCLICTDHSKWAKKITFYFGYKNNRNYLYKYTGGWSARVGTLFSNKKYTIDWDYGCIKLKKKVGNKVGWFGTKWCLSDSSLTSQYVYVGGYRNGLLKYDSGYMGIESWQHVRYNMDTKPGTSGGPIFTPDYYAVGINIAENDYANYGYRLTNVVKDDLDGL